MSATARLPAVDHGQRAWRRLLALAGVLGVALAAPPLLFPRGEWPVYALGLLAVACLACALSGRRFLFDTPIFVSLLDLAATALLGLYVSPDVSLSLPRLYGLVLGFAVYYVAVSTATGPRRFWPGVGLLVTSAVPVAVLGAVGTQWSPTKFAFLVPLYPRLPRLITEVQASFGTVNAFNPNEVGGTLAFLLPLPLALLLGGRLRWFTWLGVALVTIVGLAVFVLSASRTAYVALAVVTLALVVWRWRWRGLLGDALALAAAGYLLWASGVLVDAWGAVATNEGSAAGVLGSLPLSSRPAIWAAALAMIGDFPFTGTGVNAFDAVGSGYGLGNLVAARLVHAHNLFLQVALDFGVVGLVAFVALLALAGRSGVRAYRRLDGPRELAAVAGLLAGLGAYLLFGLADAVALGAKPTVLVWLMLGLLVAAERIPQDVGSARRGCPPVPKGPEETAPDGRHRGRPLQSDDGQIEIDPAPAGGFVAIARPFTAGKEMPDGRHGEGPLRWLAGALAVIVVAQLTFPYWASALYVNLGRVDLNRAAASLNDSRYASALAHAREAVRLRQDNPRAQLLLGLALEASEGPKAALLALERAVALSPADATAHFQLAEALYAAGRGEEAVPHWQAAGSGPTLYARANAARSAKDLPEAERLFRYATGADPALMPAWLGLAQTIAAQARYTEAYLIYGEMIDRFPAASSGYEGRADLLANRFANRAGALATVELGLARVPANTQQLRYLRSVYRSYSEDWAGAEADAREAITLAPANGWYRAWLGDLYLRQKRYGEALAAYAAIPGAVQPQEVAWQWRTRQRVAGVQAARQNWAAATDEMQVTLSVALAQTTAPADLGALHAQLGGYLAKAGRTAEAIAAYESAQRYAPENAVYTKAVADLRKVKP